MGSNPTSDIFFSFFLLNLQAVVKAFPVADSSKSKRTTLSDIPSETLSFHSTNSCICFAVKQIIGEKDEAVSETSRIAIMVRG